MKDIYFKYDEIFIYISYPMENAKIEKKFLHGSTSEFIVVLYYKLGVSDFTYEYKGLV